MKKIACVLVLACVVMGAASAQAKKNAVALDLFPLLKGIVVSNKDVTDISIFAAFEHLVAPNFSIGPDLDFSIFMPDAADYNIIYFGLSLEGRYYTMASFDKFFVGATLGFNMLSVDGKTKTEDGGFMGLTTSLKMGYKVVPPKKNAFIEPSLSYVLSKSSIAGEIPTPLGLQGGLRLGFIF